MIKLATVMVAALFFQGGAALARPQEIGQESPSEYDLRAAYCFESLKNLLSAWPKLPTKAQIEFFNAKCVEAEDINVCMTADILSHAIENYNSRIRDMERLRLYLVNRSQYIDLSGLLIPDHEADMDWQRYQSSGSNIEIKLAYAKRQSQCRDLNWLPY